MVGTDTRPIDPIVGRITPVVTPDKTLRGSIRPVGPSCGGGYTGCITDPMSFFWSGTVVHMFRRSSSNRLRGLASLLVAAVAFGSVIDHGTAQQKTAKPTAKKLAPKPKAGTKTSKTKNETPQEAAKRAAAEAVERLLRQVFGGRPAAVKPGPPVPNGFPRAILGKPKKPKKPVGNGDPTARDRVDLLAPQDPRQAKLLRQAHDWMKSGQHARVLEAVSVLLNPPAGAKFEADSLFRGQQGRWITVRDEANRLLGQLPESFRETFRTRFGAEATRRLAEAETSGGESEMVEVADRFFHTKAGRQAANRLASRHIDRGRLGLAAFWLDRLLEASDPVASATPWRLKAAWVFHRVGQPERVKTMLAGLSDAGRLTLPGGREVGRAQWLGPARPAIVPEPVLRDWPVFFGSPGRRGRADGGSPLLLSRWHRRMTHRHAVAAVVRELVEDLGDLGQSMIPAFVPLVVGNKAIFRTLRGIEVIDIDTGQVLWETRPDVAVESLMVGRRGIVSRNGVRAGGFVPQVARVGGGRVGNVRFGPVNGAAMNHPLTGLLFQHSLHGIPSSDGQQVFLVQEGMLLRNPPPSMRFGGFNPFGGSGARQPGQWNTLAAFDLVSGRPSWEVGGAKMDEPFDLPLSGTRFLGAPAPQDGKLYVVGEQDNEVRLHVLEAATGQPVWSRRIAYVDGPALRDPNRRWASSHVAVSDGVAVCPTTVGWLVGVECSSRRILWAHRYAGPQPESRSAGPGMPGMMRVGGAGANTPGARMASGWAAAPPVICGDRVVFTPHAEPVLNCLDLFTGRLLWKKKKGSFLYVAGGFAGRLLLVGSDSVAAFDMADGKAAWTHKLQPSEGRPCGRGVATDDHFHLPLSSGQICTLALSDGNVASRTYLPESSDEGAVLGNLVMSQGLVLALGPEGLTAYEQREALVVRIEAALEKDSADGWALLKQSELALLGRGYVSAMRFLEAIDRKKLKPELVARYRDALRTALAGAVRVELAVEEDRVDKRIEQLAGLADSIDRQRMVQRLRVERAVARREWESAVAGFRELAHRFGTHRITQGVQDPVRVRLDRWVGGQLADLWPKLPEDLRARLDKQLAADASAVIGKERLQQRTFAEVFAFHPASRSVRFHLATVAARNGRVGEAEVTWLRLAEDADPAVGTRARKALVDFRSKRGLGGPARRADWPKEVEIVRAAGSSRSVRRQDLELNRQRLPWFDSHRTVYDSSRQRLIVERAEDGGVSWSVPLPQSGRSGTSMYLPARAVGHQVVVFHRGVVQALSPTTRELLWSHSLDAGLARSTSIRPRPPVLVPAETAATQLNLVVRNARRGPLRVVNREIICVSGRRRLTSLEPRTGEVLWQRDRVASGIPVMGSDKIVYLGGGPARSQKPTTGKPIALGTLPFLKAGYTSRPPVALRARDGHPLEVAGLARKLEGVLRLEGTTITWIRNGGSFNVFGLKWSHLSVQQDDVVSGKTLWQHKLVAGTRLGMIGEDQLVLLAGTGRLDRLDLKTGKLAAVGQIATGDLKGATSIYAFHDSENLYVAVNRPIKGSYYSVNLHSIRVNGPLLAFSRAAAGGPPRWRKQVDGLNLVLDKLEHAPLLLLASRQYLREGNLRYYLLKLQALDKRTGQVRASLETPSNYWSFNGLTLNLAEKYLELGSYNQRIRLNVGGQQRASVKP